MPNWNAVLNEISKAKPTKPSESQFDVVRRKYLAALHQHTGRNVICYYSGFLTNRVELAEINDDDKNGFMLCVHKMQRDKGLDLILHTGGGDIGAVESLVFYLREMFGGNVRAIIPQLAMSAGAMIACSCTEIVMGKHSAIGPVDPQLSGLPAVGVLEEFEAAWKQIDSNEKYSLLWDPILSKISPSFIEQCKWAIARSKEFLAQTLREGMFSELSYTEASARIAPIVERLTSHNDNKGHNRHIHYKECQALGLKIKLLEDPADKKFQDLVLTVHHTFMHALSNTPAVKIIENHSGRAQVRIFGQYPLQMMQQPIAAPPVAFPAPVPIDLLQRIATALEMNSDPNGGAAIEEPVAPE